jgi:hypothetical protein
MDVKTEARLTLISVFLQFNPSKQEKQKTICRKVVANSFKEGLLQKSIADYRIVRFLNDSVYSKLFCLFFNLFLFNYSLYAQDSLNFEFGKIKLSDFNQAAPKFDSGASAVIIADIGKTYFEGDRVESMNIIFTRFMRVKILNKNGFHAADYEIRLINNADFNDESILELRGSTFNLENGIIQETKLETNAVYTEKYNKYISVKKFTMPSLKEGSIYDITYTLKIKKSVNIKSWDFQSIYPCLWSEYQVKIPFFHHYHLELKVNQPFDIDSKEIIPEKFAMKLYNGRGQESGSYRLTGNSTLYKWVKKNVPSFKDETYISSIKNYIDGIKFQYNYFQFDSLHRRIYSDASWIKLSEEYYVISNLKESFETNNTLLDEEIQKILVKSNNNDEIIHSMYFFVRDNFKCTGHSAIFPGHSLWETLKNRSGTEAELNILLMFMLRQANIIAEIALLSTSENGFATQDYPMLDEYNYLICIVHDNKKDIKLDASWPENPFGSLLPNCYNGGARVLNDHNARLIRLLPDSLIESKRTNVIIASDDNGALSGSLSTIYGFENSFKIRADVKKTSMKEYFKSNQFTSANEINTLNYEFDSLGNSEVPLVENCDIDFKDLFKSGMVYFNPIIGFSLRKNPFNSVERRFPVEMPYKKDDIYILSMDIPKGFQVEEIPKSEKINLNDDQGIFEYIVDKNPDNIQLRVHIMINKTVFSVNDYSGLREFYNYVLKKESEQIVFKKIH